MFKRPMLAAAAVAIALHPTEGKAQQEIETVLPSPSETMTFTAHYVAHDAGLFQNESLKLPDRDVVGVTSPNALFAGSPDFTATALSRTSSSAERAQTLQSRWAASGDLSRPRASC